MAENPVWVVLFPLIQPELLVSELVESAQLLPFTVLVHNSLIFGGRLSSSNKDNRLVPKKFSNYLPNPPWQFRSVDVDVV